MSPRENSTNNVKEKDGGGVRILLALCPFCERYNVIDYVRNYFETCEHYINFTPSYATFEGNKGDVHAG